MPIKNVGDKWRKWVASQAGKVRERVPPHLRKKPESPLWKATEWGALSDDERAARIESERQLYLARQAERSAAARREKAYQAELRLQQRQLEAKRRALREEEQRLQREEEHLASKLRAEAEDAQWDYEKDMEDYVMGRKPIV
jgi:hypothetical protein